MSASNRVIRELEVKGLATFTAFENSSIKVVFDDRTIVRMQAGLEIIRILSRLGEELVFNVQSIARN